ncbi:hypothetical protein J2S57_003056 [Kineosporia succinea]|uniref:Uncharacterized protein n=1 Tax=Kineosporia succinea TaxID=84632 RepID=A0ABT9P3N7_9ACTN|nr:hypothetical protein [Kineosporia succinea]
MNRRRTPHFWFPILLLRDALGRFTSVRRPFSPSKPRRPQRKTTLLVFVQLELTLA